MRLCACLVSVHYVEHNPTPPPFFVFIIFFFLGLQLWVATTQKKYQVSTPYLCSHSSSRQKGASGSGCHPATTRIFWGDRQAELLDIQRACLASPASRAISRKYSCWVPVQLTSTSVRFTSEQCWAMWTPCLPTPLPVPSFVSSRFCTPRRRHSPLQPAITSTCSVLCIFPQVISRRGEGTGGPTPAYEYAG